MPRKLLLPMMLVGLLGALAWIPLRQAGWLPHAPVPAIEAGVESGLAFSPSSSVRPQLRRWRCGRCPRCRRCGVHSKTAPTCSPIRAN
ncbi:MAG: hypothetical protein NVV67_00840 [Pseudoxanthomonas sp.]|nr:hypothetical protein [Pseudoxanthomonas sp.]